jgi:beta-N-acetylhexosaminidase
MPAAMTAHVVFTAIDAEAPASTSARVTKDIIRDAIGFDGLLMSDDLGMRALTGSIAERATAVLVAGSDLALLCSGDAAEIESVAAAVPALQGAAQARFANACAVFRQQTAFDAAEAEARLGELSRGLA